MSTTQHVIDAAIQHAGGVALLANAVGIRQSAISNWRARGTQPNAAYCAAIERATNGAVTRKDLRPLDWHLIWPELAEASGAVSKHALRPDIFEGQAQSQQEACHA